MSDAAEVCRADELGPREVVGAGPYAVVRSADGDLYALGRKCRHLRADLADGSVDKSGCLVCPRHGARFDLETAKMVRGPQVGPGAVEKVVRVFSGWFPQKTRPVVERDGVLYVE